MLRGVEPAAPAPDAVWSRYGDRRHVLFVLVGVLVFCALTALGYNAFGNLDGAAKVIGGIITGFFAVMLCFCVVAAVALPFRRHRLPGVAIDAAGIWWYRDRRVSLVPWSDIASVGVGHLRAPSAAVAAGAAPGQRKNLALDVFLRARPADRLRFAIPTASDGHDLHAAVTRHAPQLWVGEYEREWTRLGMFGK